MLYIGIIGLPRCGKTTLFQALCPTKGLTEAHTGKREVHIGQARVLDSRLDELSVVFQPEKQVNALVEYLDVAGVSAGDAKKASLEGKFLSEIRTCDALLHVLRAFDLPGETNNDPVRDFRLVEQEFLLADQIVLEKRLERLRKDVHKVGTPEIKAELELMERCVAALAQELPLRELTFTAIEELLLRPYQPFTLKPQLVVLNVGEEAAVRLPDSIAQYSSNLQSLGVEVSGVCATLEREIGELDDSAAREFMSEWGLTESARDRLIRASYHLLGLISFFTIGGDEVHAWTIKQGTAAKEAAGVVHSDMERGFIRAEVVHYDDFIQRRDLVACRSAGVRRLEGRDYVVKDGDIIEFRFAV